jgi:hypothetical protein
VEIKINWGEGFRFRMEEADHIVWQDHRLGVIKEEITNGDGVEMVYGITNSDLLDSWLKYKNGYTSFNTEKELLEELHRLYFRSRK